MANEIVRLTESSMRPQEQHYANNAEHRVTRDIIVKYAQSGGGLTLEFWKRARGAWFGEPVIMKPSHVAKELGVAISDIDKIWIDSWAYARAEMRADPDIRRLQDRK